MDIGLSHAIAVDGRTINAEWSTFNAKLITGKKHEIFFYDHVLKLEEVFSKLDNPLLKVDNFTGEFISQGYTGDVEIFKSTYQVKVNPDAPLEIRTFLYVADGVPWAMCVLDENAILKQNQTTTFLFVSTLKVLNNKQLTQDVWNVNDDNYDINYSAAIAAPSFTSSKITTSTAVTTESTNADIVDVLKTSDDITDNIVAKKDVETLSISLKSTSKKTIDNLKAAYINLFWNVGIVFYFEKSSNYKNKNQNGLTVGYGDEIILDFNMNFKEV